MLSDLWYALTAFALAGYNLYRTLSKKAKQKNILTSAISVGAFFIFGVFYIIPSRYRFEMVRDLWFAFIAFALAGYLLYRVLAKKDKQQHILLSGIGIGAFFIIGVLETNPFLAKLTAKWFFST